MKEVRRRWAKGKRFTVSCLPLDGRGRRPHAPAPAVAMFHTSNAACGSPCPGEQPHAALDRKVALVPPDKNKPAKPSDDLALLVRILDTLPPDLQERIPAADVVRIIHATLREVRR